MSRMTAPPLYIFDLDGTLANIDHRVPILQQEDEAKWRRFYAQCYKDAPILANVQTLNRLRLTGAEVRIWTGRSEEVQEMTIDWLVNFTSFEAAELWQPSVLKMRGVDNHTPDHVLKGAWLNKLSMEDRKRVVAVFEDRAQVVKMWRSRGLTCYQVAEGNF